MRWAAGARSACCSLEKAEFGVHRGRPLYVGFVNLDVRWTFYVSRHLCAQADGASRFPEPFKEVSGYQKAESN